MGPGTAVKLAPTLDNVDPPPESLKSCVTIKLVSTEAIVVFGLGLIVVLAVLGEKKRIQRSQDAPMELEMRTDVSWRVVV